jgi:hypothetical protein
MTTAPQLRDALLAIARPQPKKLPPALAGVFPDGCHLRARTAAEDLALDSELNFVKDDKESSEYEKGQQCLFLALSYSLCDASGELLVPGDWGKFENLPVWSLEPIQKELAALTKAEQAEQGKD